jgi:hypothetical protein
MQTAKADFREDLSTAGSWRRLPVPKKLPMNEAFPLAGVPLFYELRYNHKS